MLPEALSIGIVLSNSTAPVEYAQPSVTAFTPTGGAPRGPSADGVVWRRE